jgi:cyclic pyranopterin phosphate synthase
VTDDPAPDDLTHVEAGEAGMVDVGEKPRTARRAVARGGIRLRAETVAALREDELGKGDALAVARVAATQAAKHTWETVPMCHQIPLTDVDAEFVVGDGGVTCEVAVETTARTGCEMEALQAVTTGLCTVWDMVKSVEKVDGAYPEAQIGGIEVVERES